MLSKGPGTSADYVSGRRRRGLLHLGLELRSRIIRRHLRGGGRLLDLGSADGAMLQALRRRVNLSLAVGLERSPELAALILENGVCGSGLALPFRDGSFDFVVCSATRKHIRDSALLMREIARALAPGGTVIVVDPHPWLLRLGRRLGKFDPRYLAHLSYAKEIAGEFRQAGLQPFFQRNSWFICCAARKGL